MGIDLHPSTYIERQEEDYKKRTKRYFIEGKKTNSRGKLPQNTQFLTACTGTDMNLELNNYKLVGMMKEITLRSNTIQLHE